MKIIEIVKNFIKSHEELYDYIVSLKIPYDTGYIRGNKRIKRALKKIMNNQNKNFKQIQYNPDKKDIYIFIGDKNIDSTMRKAVFGDIDNNNVNDHECIFFTSRELKNKNLKKFHDFFFKVNKIIPLPFKPKWDEMYSSYDLEKYIDRNIFFVFMVGPYYPETYSQPKLLKKIYNMQYATFARRIMYLVDPVDKYYGIKNWFPYFDMICSYTENDCKKYNFEYIDSPCVNFNLSNNVSSVDIYFRAMDAGRAKFVDDCYHYLSNKNVKCDFHIQTTTPNFVSKHGMEFSNNRVSYYDMVKSEINSNVMLEVIIPGIGSGTTLRYKEAVMYNKKLLTNNSNVNLLPCYNPKYIKYFEKPEDIDIDWLLRREPVIYDYQMEFSTDCFCEKIKNLSLRD